MMYRDRVHAGQELARALKRFKNTTQTVVIGLPRGGVVVAYEVARELELPLDIIVPRKLGAEGNPELTEDGDPIWNETERAAASPEYLERVITEERAEAQRRHRVYRGARPPLKLKGKTAILVDDGVATGLTMRAAVISARHKGAAKVIVAVPHGAADSLRILGREADQIIAIDRPVWYGAVGTFYENFPQTSDEEVIALIGAHPRL